MNDPGGDDSGHLSDTQLAAFLDRGLAPVARRHVEEHLAGCPECRAHIVAAGDLLAHDRRPRRSLLVGSLVAAAALLLAVGLTARSGQRGIRQPVVRAAGTDARLVAYGPMGETSSRAIRFVWGRAPDAVTYRLSVTRADGVAVWSRSVADTVAVLPDSVALGPGQSYFWVADALLRDGTTRSTGLRAFEPVR